MRRVSCRRCSRCVGRSACSPFHLLSLRPFGPVPPLSRPPANDLPPSSSSPPLRTPPLSLRTTTRIHRRPFTSRLPPSPSLPPPPLLLLRPFPRPELRPPLQSQQPLNGRRKASLVALPAVQGRSRQGADRGRDRKWAEGRRSSGERSGGGRTGRGEAVEDGTEGALYVYHRQD